MYAPVVTRFMTYDVNLEPRLKTYASMIMALPEMQEWIEAAKAEPADIEEKLDAGDCRGRVRKRWRLLR